MTGVRLLLRDSPLAGALIALRKTIEEEKASITTALEEISATREAGIVPGNRHENSIPDQVYDALAGCKRLIQEHWREYGAQKVALSVFAIWDMEISPGQLRLRRHRQGSSMED